ncbi:MaoC/PaaZ C-terminal domain-containing protein [Solimonas soli]|uniref:MaoC/PaaZ C-terminal domain-containing protein n=1 Tax=Solimonas soli TaxID=413479 RepID=UPI0004897797|nr:MaoC/PaaZ C-terminal domain-containing protein [Solimonas soli]
MPAQYDQLLQLAIPDSRQTYTATDAMRYALSLGLGADPLDEAQLAYVYEKNLRVLPTMGVVLAHPGFWARELDSGIDWVKIVHAEQGLVLHRPLPPQASVTGRSRIVDIIDKGPGKGALVYYERRIFDAASGEPLCTSTQTLFCRGDGGIGGPAKAAAPPPAMPARAPDLVCDIATDPRMALQYRLNGDMNPLHADPAVARKAGFERPILHGLATYGVAGHALLQAVCGYDASRIAEIAARFTAPVYPGETLRTEIWVDGEQVSFTVRVPVRDVVAIGNGRAVIRAARS